MTAADASGGGGPSRAAAWSALGLASALYFVSFVDRVIPALLVQPLEAAFRLSDLQIGLLFGPAFAVFYAGVGLPLARMADRGARVPLIAAGAVLWGACTMASGLVDSYWALVLLRLGLAVGEASLTPAVYSLIGGLFRPAQQVRAASIYSAVGVAGASAAYILGAVAISAAHRLAPHLGAVVAPAPWRLVFAMVGAPAAVLGLMIAVLVREPARPAEPQSGGLARVLASRASLYGFLFLGAAALQAAAAAYAAWGAEHLHRDLGLPIAAAGAAYGLAGLLGAGTGVLLVPSLARRWQAAGRPDAIIRAALLAGAVGGVGAAIAPVSGSAAGFLWLSGIGAFGLFGASTGLVVAMQVLAPASHRASLVAVFILCITLLGQGLGPPAVPLVAGLIGGPSALAGGLGAVSLLATISGLLLLSFARGPVARFVLAGLEPQPAPPPLKGIPDEARTI